MKDAINQHSYYEHGCMCVFLCVYVLYGISIIENVQNLTTK